MKLLKPHLYSKSVKAINFYNLHKKGYRGILFDIDNTLVPHGEGINEEIKNFITDLRKQGYRVGLVSNNDRKRVKKFNSVIKLPYIHNARKPLPYNYKKLAGRLGLSVEKVVFIGDQLFTDILGANLAGIKSILVKPINNDEPFNIRLKRLIERFFLRNIYE